MVMGGVAPAGWAWVVCRCKLTVGMTCCAVDVDVWCACAECVVPPWWSCGAMRWNAGK